LSAAASPTPNYVATVARVAWPNLPTLLIGDWVISLAALFVVVVAPGASPVAVILWALIVAPIFGALLAQISDMTEHKAVSPLSVFAYSRRYGVISISVWLVPAVSAASSLVALQWWKQTRDGFALLATSAGGCATVVLILGAVAALPIAIREPSARGVPLFLLSLHIVARRPVPIVAVLALLAIGAWASASLSPSIIVLIPALLALVNHAAVWTSALVVDLHPDDEVGETRPA